MATAINTSSREFAAFTAENGEITYHIFTAMLLFSALSKDFYEWEAAVQEIADSILDLEPGESVYFSPNRDDAEAKGIILRTK